MDDNISFGSGLPMHRSNCTFLSHCKSDILSDSSITCDFVWDILLPVNRYSPYVAAIEAVFFLISFLWNSYIMISFIARRNYLKEPASIYLLNVAVTDFLLSIFVIFQCFMTESAGRFFVGNTDIIRCGLCEFLGFIVMFLVFSTLHTLAILSFDRFFLLIKPLTYKRYFNWKKALVIIFFIWLLSFGLAIPPIFGLGEYSFNTVIANCHPMWGGISAAGINNFNYIILTSTETLFPIILLIVTNIWTCKIVLKALKDRLKRRKAIRVHPLNQSGDAKSSNSKDDLEYNRKQLQLVKVFGALFIAHICCWTPVLTVVVVAIFVRPSSIPLEVFVAGWILFLTNPVAHPIIETYFIKDLRTNMIKAEEKVRRSLSHPSSLRNSFLTKSVNQSSNKRRAESFNEPQTAKRLEENRKALSSLRKENSFLLPGHQFNNSRAAPYSINISLELVSKVDKETATKSDDHTGSDLTPKCIHLELPSMPSSKCATKSDSPKPMK